MLSVLLMIQARVGIAGDAAQRLSDLDRLRSVACVLISSRPAMSCRVVSCHVMSCHAASARPSASADAGANANASACAGAGSGGWAARWRVAQLSVLVFDLVFC